LLKGALERGANCDRVHSGSGGDVRAYADDHEIGKPDIGKDTYRSHRVDRCRHPIMNTDDGADRLPRETRLGRDEHIEEIRGAGETCLAETASVENERIEDAARDVDTAERIANPAVAHAGDVEHHGADRLDGKKGARQTQQLRAIGLVLGQEVTTG